MNETTNTIFLGRAELWLCISTLVYFLVNGAQIFETFVIVPKWTASPPESLQYFRGKYGMDLKTFWIASHTIHEISFICAIFFCWNSPVRNTLLILFCIHLAVRIWTIIYFAPQLISFQKLANEGGLLPGMAAKAILWRNLNYLRVAIFIVVSIGLISVCLKMLHVKLR